MKHEGTWRIRWFDGDGERQREVYTTECDAQLPINRQVLAADAIRRGLRPRSLQSRKFTELADYWLEHRAPKQATEGQADRRIIRKHLMPAFGSLKVSEMSVSCIDEWRQGLEVGEKTEFNILTLINSTFHLANDFGWLTEVPGLKKPKITDIGTNYRRLRATLSPTQRNHVHGLGRQLLR